MFATQSLRPTVFMLILDDLNVAAWASPGRTFTAL